MKTVALVIAMVSGACATPYQAMGIRGGFEDATFGSDAYVVHVAANGWTPVGTALVFAYRRAGELCTAGFELDEAHSFVRSGDAAPDVFLRVRCKPQHGWWCTVRTDGTGPCVRTSQLCESAKTNDSGACSFRNAPAFCAGAGCFSTAAECDVSERAASRDGASCAPRD